ncbi:MAG: hypothetical protein JAZ17_07655 [Candidatus Thiodiazotropha endolucinida]|nr:hypothetical protein [Candidatus Thiodiazotropha taylori]MCG8093490.1 hypothetical protein [Candidatus Thiodiazotropha endolucinida]MCG8045826.1 hypothetical protein [Candidatus Thiodiazotropha taylori]MCG8049825.1 hypothetical protein [Candidatus Thiodiazotropha taylori]MCW4311641.1 hypothetical protein [Candidatus Thiodiazotropha taylori]
MPKHIHVKEAVHNAARSLREHNAGDYRTDSELADRHQETAIRNGHQQAAAFWAEVVKFCKAKENIGPGFILYIEPYPAS